MLIFWRQGLVVLANPKTGTTALEAALAPHASVVIQRPPALKHTGAARYQRHLAPFLGDGKDRAFTLVGVMREPVDWLGSWYRYRQRGEEPAEKSTRGISFDAFVRAWCQEAPPEFARVGQQAQFLAPRGGRQCDRIFRYENMGTFLAFLRDRLGVEVDLPQANVSPPAPLGLEPATLALARKAHARDFALYAKRAE